MKKLIKDFLYVTLLVVYSTVLTTLIVYGLFGVLGNL